jgi:hypothetical protein
MHFELNRNWLEDWGRARFLCWGSGADHFNQT